jgi:hypothetical protein
MVIAKTRLEKIPENCWACEYYGCTLPFKVRQPDLLKQAYKTKRHKDCPLREVDLDEHHKARN